MRGALRGVSELSLVPRARYRRNLPLHVVGLALLFLVPGMLLATLVEWVSATSHGERPLLTAALITAGVGAVLFSWFRPPDDVRPSDVFPVVVWTWLSCSLLGGLPYVLDADVFGWAQWDSALFESISGFTASGSTVLTDIDSHGRGMLLWRQLTQWYGGMGMVVLAVSVLPLLGVGGQELMRAEAPGPDSDRLAPRISGTAKRLWLLYAGLTAAVAVALFAIPGVGLYDAVAHALTAAGTGGFSPHGDSIGHFTSLAAELVMAAGMIAGAMSFSLHYRALRGDWRAYRRASDQMLFLKILLAATATITLLLWLRQGASFGLSLRDAFFNVVTLATSGGFHNIRPGGLGDFAAWTPPAQVILGVLMLIGGGAGSTSGGMKVFRAQISAAHALRTVRLARRPRSVVPVKLGGAVIPEHVVGRVLGFGTLYIMTFGVGSLIVASLGAEPVTAVSGVISALSNMGPALGEAGPSSDFTVFARPARLVLAAFMVVGRLEITAVFLGAAVILRHLQGRR
ncbi:MAG: TrkH family potassium uptake protein [Acidimicrobiia bacterium]|nr:TrkH family potassium uptake protein [Acidimicrobiia bacterium]MYB25300.1 TrkH family potassium uptake protein [Acidimicrobiia bacterium]MYJ14024.1 TrkH family potassium uptake protein [Acidimicrobiia bacterium]